MKKQIILIFTALLSLGTIQSCKDACGEITCLNGGTCDDGTCQCPEGFSGETCELANNSMTIDDLTGSYLFDTIETRCVFTPSIPGFLENFDETATQVVIIVEADPNNSNGLMFTDTINDLTFTAEIQGAISDSTNYIIPNQPVTLPGQYGAFVQDGEISGSGYVAGSNVVYSATLTGSIDADSLSGGIFNQVIDVQCNQTQVSGVKL